MTQRLTRYELWHDDPRGNRLDLLDACGPFSYSLLTNERGAFEITLPGVFDGVFALDDMIEVWRGPEDGALVLENVYFVRRIRYFDDDNGADWISIAGPDLKDLLRRRIVAYYAASAKADMTDYLDDMIKAVVTDNLAGDAATDYDGAAVTGRDLTSLNFSVQVDLSGAPSVTRSFSWRNLLILFGELVNDSYQQGTRLYFDVVPVMQSDGTIGAQLRTYTGQPGQDHTWDSSSPVVFGREWGNLSLPSLTYDYSDEVNFVYSGGEGEQDGRNIQEVSDTERIGASPWNRCEGFTDARNEDTDAGVQARGRADLEAGQPVIEFDGVLLDTPQARYGRAWRHGDLVTAEYRGMQLDGVVTSVWVSVDEEGKETLEAKMELV